ncbi:MAG: hypothetical protein IJ298_04275 [Ruminococcus sp.]|nr:hypothetical protein [Ruminococcus sp.]
MAHKEPRVECKFYLLPEERDHLKQVAKEKEVSFSDLLRTTVLKKYPMSKKRKARSVDLASPIAKGIPPVLPEQEPLETPVPEKRESPVVEVVSCDVESMTRDEQEARLKFLKHKIHMAYNGESLDKEVFNAYMQERNKLRAKLGHK